MKCRYIGIIAFITLHVLNNYLPKDGHQCCQRVHYIQNWSCVKYYKKSYFCRMCMGYTSKPTIPYRNPVPPSISWPHFNPKSIQILSFHIDTKSYGVDTVLQKHTTSILRQPPKNTASIFLWNTATQTTCNPNLDQIMFFSPLWKPEVKNLDIYIWKEYELQVPHNVLYQHSI